MSHDPSFPMHPSYQFVQSSRPVDVTVSVRQLVSFVHRTGGLATLSFGNVSGQQGSRTHQAFFRKLAQDDPSARFVSEYSLRVDFRAEHFMLRIQGRADVLAQRSSGEEILEVKSVGIPLEELLTGGEDLHWAQTRAYAYLHARKKRADRLAELPAEDQVGRYQLLMNFDNEEIQYALYYVSTENLRSLRMERRESMKDLEAWFLDTCKQYLNFAGSLREYQKKRNNDIRRMSFPYQQLRDGQKLFMQRVLRSIRNRTPLLVQAPTGTGKTMSTLYPAVKALGAAFCQQIFYLTAKTSTRQVAEQALHDLCGEDMALRRITFMAKEKLCLHPDIYCDTRICPCALAYYRHLQEGLAELLAQFTLLPEGLMEVGRKYNLCPFELALDVSLYCDVIICDYNHAFDPRVRLDRYFNQPDTHLALLIDEAHNLPDRVREMYSADLSKAAIDEAVKLIDEYMPSCQGYMMPLQRYFFQLQERMLQIGTESSIDLAFPLQEEDRPREEMMQMEGFMALRQPVPKFLQLLRALVFQLQDRLDEFDDSKLRRAVLDVYFSARYFLKVADEFYTDRYVFAAEKDSSDLRLRLICLDVSDRLIGLYRNQHAAVFFSATLSPMSYFSRIFCGLSRDDQPERLVLHSPFPPENLSVAVFETLQTTYKEREKSLSTLVKVVANTVIYRPGNYLLFFPSYRYLQEAAALLRKLLSGQAIDLQCQSKQMSEAAKKLFLEAFARQPEEVNGRSLLALAVLGGIFGEGIDLTGEKLSGVMVVGTGIPQISPERELMRAFYEEKNHQGYAFAYQYPGFNKVMQAAGRLIRSDQDKGLILLLDQRYARPDYRQLFPEEWDPVYIHDAVGLRKVLREAPHY